MYEEASPLRHKIGEFQMFRLSKNRPKSHKKNQLEKFEFCLAFLGENVCFHKVIDLTTAIIRSNSIGNKYHLSTNIKSCLNSQLFIWRIY